MVVAPRKGREGKGLAGAEVVLLRVAVGPGQVRHVLGDRRGRGAPGLQIRIRSPSQPRRGEWGRATKGPLRPRSGWPVSGQTFRGMEIGPKDFHVLWMGRVRGRAEW